MKRRRRGGSTIEPDIVIEMGPAKGGRTTCRIYTPDGMKSISGVSRVEVLERLTRLEQIGKLAEECK